MKKIMTLLVAVLMFMIMPNVNAADVTQYFTVTDAKACTTQQCTTVYDENNLLGSNVGVYISLDWEYNNPNAEIAAGDTVSIPLANETNTETTINYSVSSMSWSPFYDSATNEKLGRWRILNSKKIEIEFSDYAVGRNSVTGTFITGRNVSPQGGAPSDMESKPSTLTVGNYKITVWLKPSNFIAATDSINMLAGTPGDKSFYVGLYTPGITIKQLYQKQPLTDAAKIQDLYCEIVKPDDAISYSISIQTNIHSISNATDKNATATAANYINIISYFTRVDSNQGETLTDYKQRLQPLQYGAYKGSDGTEIVVVNFGKQPSDTITYADAIANIGGTHTEPGDRYISQSPFTISRESADYINEVVGTAAETNNYLPRYRLYFAPTYNPITSDMPAASKTKTVSGSCSWTALDGSVHSEQRSASATLTAGVSETISRGTSKLVLIDKNSGEAIQGAQIKLEKQNGLNWETIDTKTTSETGEVTFTNLEDGTYRYSQTSYANHYIQGTFAYYANSSLSSPIQTFEFSSTDAGEKLYATNEREKHTITFKKGNHGTFDDIVKQNQLWGDQTPVPTNDQITGETDYVFRGWTPEVSTKINGDATYTATWAKMIKVTVKHVTESGDNIIPAVVTPVEEGKPYGPYTVDTNLLNTYDLVTAASNASGTAGTSNITVTFVYKKKKGTITVIHKDVDTNATIRTDGPTEKEYEESYSTTKMNDSTYDYVRVEGAESGVINKPSTIVTYYYKKKTGKVVIQYLDKDNNNAKIINDVTAFNDKYGTSYDTRTDKQEKEATTEFKSYNYDSKSGTETGTINEATTTVKYYYVKKPAQVITRYVELKDDGSEGKVFDTKTVDKKYDDAYETTSTNNKVPKNYKLEDRTGDPASGTVDKDTVTVTYLFSKKASDIQESASKTGTAKTTSSSSPLTYKIKYDYNVTDYIGEANITLVDSLPYEIDEAASELDGGVYNNSAKTIAWTQVLSIDSYTDNAISIEKNITLVYKNIDPTGDAITNEVTGTIILDNNRKENIMTTYTVEEEIPGYIIVKHVTDDGKELKVETIEQLAGDSVSTSEKSFEGYVLKSKPETEVYELSEDGEEVVYTYEKVSYTITTSILKGKGYVEGDEIVKYGEDSKNNIKITAANGSYISKVLVDGKEYKIKEEATSVTVPNFKNVKENHKIEVEFEYLAGLSKDVPKTGNVLSIVWPILIIAIVILSLFLVTVFSNKKMIKKVK